MTLSEKINLSEEARYADAAVFLLQYDLVESVDLDTNKITQWKFSSPIYAKKAFMETFGNNERPLNESAPPSPEIEKWIKRVKPEFIKRYGKDEYQSYLYGRAWKMYNKQLKESAGFQWSSELSEDAHATNVGGGQIAGTTGEPPGPKKWDSTKRYFNLLRRRGEL